MTEEGKTKLQIRLIFFGPGNKFSLCYVALHTNMHKIINAVNSSSFWKGPCAGSALIIKFDKSFLTEQPPCKIRDDHAFIIKLLPHLIVLVCLLSFDILCTISAHLRVIILGGACLTAPINCSPVLQRLKNLLKSPRLMYASLPHYHRHICCLCSITLTSILWRKIQKSAW